MTNTNPFDNYLDLVEAAQILRIHPQSLRRLIKQKKIPAVLFAGKYLIERDKLEMFKANYDPRPGRKPVRRLL
jgi:excisionase family DNA binding protein